MSEHEHNGAAAVSDPPVDHDDDQAPAETPEPVVFTTHRLADPALLIPYVRVKVQNFSKDKKKANCVGYIEVRDATAIARQALPHTPIGFRRLEGPMLLAGNPGDGQWMTVGQIQIGDLVFEDVGTGTGGLDNGAKGSMSDAYKRAFVLAGLGAALYGLSKQWVPTHEWAPGKFDVKADVLERVRKTFVRELEALAARWRAGQAVHPAEPHRDEPEADTQAQPAAAPATPPPPPTDPHDAAVHALIVWQGGDAAAKARVKAAWIAEGCPALRTGSKAYKAIQARLTPADDAPDAEAAATQAVQETQAPQDPTLPPTPCVDDVETGSVADTRANELAERLGMGNDDLLGWLAEHGVKQLSSLEDAPTWANVNVYALREQPQG